jgi:hypothetical protein
MLNSDELEFLEGLIAEFKDKLKDEASDKLISIYDKLKKHRDRNIGYSKKYNSRNKELHSLNTMLARYKKQGNLDKVKEIEERIRQVKELSVDV